MTMDSSCSYARMGIDDGGGTAQAGSNRAMLGKMRPQAEVWGERRRRRSEAPNVQTWRRFDIPNHDATASHGWEGFVGNMRVRRRIVDTKEHRRRRERQRRCPIDHFGLSQDLGRAAALAALAAPLAASLAAFAKSRRSLTIS